MNEMLPNPVATVDGHEWVPSTVGHGEYQCKWCMITNREAWAIGSKDGPCLNRAKNAMAVQIGGSHYKGMAIEPFELGMANHYDPCIFSMIKYVSRHPNKGRRVDLEKAVHIGQIRMAQIAKHGLPPAAIPKITIGDYISVNKLPVLEGEVLVWLHLWGTRHSSAVHGRTEQQYFEAVDSRLKALIATRYDLNTGETK